MTVFAALDADLGDALSRLTSLLAIPMLIAAAGVLVLTGIELGRWVSEAARRRRATGPLSHLARTVLDDPLAAAHLVAGAPSAPAAAALQRIGTAVAATNLDSIEHALDDFEHVVERRLDRTRMIVRAGPAIGLMGTLIPLAPGLRALGRGDIHLLTNDLRIAFAATTVGLLSGTIAFGLTLARTRRWSEDLASLERATERLRATAAAAAMLRAEADARALLEDNADPVAVR